MNASPDPEGESTWAKLRRRKVVQWGLAYGAGAWGLLQGIGFTADTFGWPAATKQVAFLLLLLGLPVAVVLAWYHGDRGYQKPVRSELAILTLLFLLGGTIFWFYGWHGETTAPSSQVASAPSNAGAGEMRPSIAVLPFENRSRLDDDAFLVDGVHDDILTQLSKIGSMKVIARTSVEQFRGTKLAVRDIGARLGVANVLEGGVQRAGDRVRITVQLIDAATEAHLWAENYDRELTASNIFEVQGEVARAVAVALHSALTPAEESRLAAVPTRNLAAWEAYQSGRQRMTKRTVAALTEAGALFDEAIEHDPQFALAYAGLADATWLLADHAGQPWDPAVAKAEELIGQALRLDPNLAEARVTLAKFAEMRREFERADALYREAIALNPSYAQAHHWYSQLLGRVGRDDDALNSMRRAVELDPMSVSLRANLAWGLSGLGKFDESLQAFRATGGIDPSSPLPYSGIGSVLSTGLARLDLAVPYLEKSLGLDPTSYSRADRLGQVYLDLGHDAKAAQLWDDTARKQVPIAGAYLRLYGGDTAAARLIARHALEVDARNGLALRLLRDGDLAGGDAASARTRYQGAFPELLEPGLQGLEWSNFEAAADLALVMQTMGDSEGSARLLELCEAHLGRLPRLGPWGYGVLDAQILAIRGRAREALAALRSAEREGWRGPYWRYYRDFDPAFASVRSDSEFEAVFADIERDMARQRAALAGRSSDALPDLADLRR